MVAVLSLVGLGIAAALTWAGDGYQLVAALLVLVTLLLLLIVASALLSVALRDFAAPIQMAAGVGCGAALRLVAALVRAHPLAFFLYIVLKVVFGFAQGMRMQQHVKHAAASRSIPWAKPKTTLRTM